MMVKMNRKTIFGIIATIIVAISIAGYIYLHNPQKQSTNNMDNLMTGVIYPALEIMVLDPNNNTVYRYVKVGDPPTKNFLLWILHSWWYTSTNKELVVPSWNAEDGTTGTPGGSWEHGARETNVGSLSAMSLKIALGTGTAQPTIDNWALINKVVEFGVTRYLFNYNETHMWIYVRGIYVASSTISFQEVGLFGYMTYGIGGNTKWFLLFRDVLPAQVTLNPNDAIVIGYYIYVRYA